MMQVTLNQDLADILALAECALLAAVTDAENCTHSSNPRWCDVADRLGYQLDEIRDLLTAI
jgi:hypothetical protein